MEILVLSFLLALSALILLVKAFGLRFVLKTQLFWDISLTIVFPIFLKSTFSGAATAVLAGVQLTAMLAFLSFITRRHGNRTAIN